MWTEELLRQARSTAGGADRRERRPRRPLAGRCDGRAVCTCTSYVDGRRSTTQALESYADAVAPVLPLDDPRIYPVSGGSEAVETAIKLARAYHLARGEDSRTLVIGRRASTTGETLGALDAGGKEALRRAYEPWSGGSSTCDRRTSSVCPEPRSPGRLRPVARGTPRPRDRRGRPVHRGGCSSPNRWPAQPWPGGPDRRLLAGDRRGVPPARRAPDRRRGDDGLGGGDGSASIMGCPARVCLPRARVRPAGTSPWVAAGTTEVFETRAPDRVRPRLHVVAQRCGCGGRSRGAAAPVRGRPSGGERAPGRTVAEVALVGVGRYHPSVGDVRGSA